MQRKGGDHLTIGRGRFAGQQALRSHAAVEIQQRLFCQPGVTAHRIGKKHLQPGIHDELQLFVVRTIHVGFQHAVLERSQADAPKLPDPGRG